TMGDLEGLLPERPSIRLVKGAYREPAALAWQRPAEVDAAYLNLAERLLSERRAGRVGRVGIATHDPRLVAEVERTAARLGVERDAYEVQMLYGIRTEGVRALRARGQPVRVLISYGEAWFPWYVRRLAERPANLALLARNLLPARG
ncbi:MAG TPA: proline dehydrogenase family protein, partial [Longimicrobiales bacterium]|nr:proline dehydrogenase family protein [Longimicrobiales bacterium]